MKTKKEVKFHFQDAMLKSQKLALKLEIIANNTENTPMHASHWQTTQLQAEAPSTKSGSSSKKTRFSSFRHLYCQK